jgi:hypothetical protein
MRHLSSRLSPALWLALFLGVWLPVSSYAERDENIWAEAQISEARPYVQQSLIYMLLIVSKISLQTVEHTPPSVASASLKRIDEQPLNYPFNMEGRRYTITAFRYAFTPLTLGKLKIPPAQIKVTTGYPRGRRHPMTPNQSFDIELETEALWLDIQAPVISDGRGEWLPLSSLNLSGKLARPAQTNVGEPFTLTLTMDALGTDGNQLPSMETFLRHSKDFSVYPERPLIQREVVPDGSVLRLSGQRKEVYTLIPQREGKLALPEISIHWWNTQSKQASVATWQAPVIKVGGSSMVAEEIPEEPSPIARSNLYFWLGVTVVVVFLGGWWVGAGYPGSRTAREWLFKQGKNLSETTAGASAVLQEQSRRSVSYVSYRFLPKALRRQGTLSTRLGHWLVPYRLRMLWQLRRIQHCPDAPACLRHLQQFAHEHLKLSRNASLPRIAKALSQTYPRLDKAALHTTLLALDKFLYAPTPEQDLARWKADLHTVCQFIPFYAPQAAKPRKTYGLPALNP